MKTQRKNSWITNILAVILGNFICAVGIKLFLEPAGIAASSTTGLAMTVEYYLNIPMSYVVFIINMAMLVLGYFALGKKFVVTTLASSFLYPAFLEILEQLIGGYRLTDDKILCILFAAVFLGMGLGILIRAGASTGGLDIPPIVVRKYFHLPVSVTMNTMDFFILGSQLLYRPVENVLYGLVMVFLFARVLDAVLMLGTTKTEVKIISEKTDEICDAILNIVDRGATLLDGESGYMREKKQIVLSVISNRELPKLERVVHEIDPECFMIVTRISQVKGKGFSISR
ncbi:MAG: YitT family protein [Firmicutes bacterium]|nr:YitT family protein [Bacillota bacterium]